MPELHSNGIHEAYLAELFNPMAGGVGYNSGVGIGGAGIGPQTPWMSTYPQQAFPQLSSQVFPQLNAPWTQQPTQTGAIVQHIAAKQAVQAIQLSQVLQALQQIVHTIAVQQQHLVQALVSYVAQPQLGAFGTQTPFAQSPISQTPFTSGGQFGTTPFGAGIGQVPGLQTQGVSQALQHQAMQQLLQYLGVQQPQTPFRYGMAA
ncbi:MAG TPA: hypothetical protein VGI30_01860 [Caulobacteraceae bacterium]|jgi:hypothetical protein